MFNCKCRSSLIKLLVECKGQRKKSKREVMREVIAKSKMYRHEKAKEVEENFEKQIDLDQQFQKLLESSTFLNVLSNPNEVTR